MKPITSAEQLQDDLESQELKEAYSEQVTASPVGGDACDTVLTSDNNCLFLYSVET